MAKTTNPKPPPRTVKIGLLKTERIAPPENSANLTPAEMQLIRAFRQVDQNTQHMILSFLQQQAAKSMLMAPKPRLTVISGGKANADSSGVQT